jgi:hypothetical protein
MLFVATLLGAVTLRNALILEVSDVRLDGTVVSALAFVRHPNVRAASLTSVAIGSSVDAAHWRVDVQTPAPFAHTFVLRASQDALLADPPYRAVVVTVANTVLRNALARLANVPGRAIDQRTQVDAHAWRRGLGDARVHAIGRPNVKALAVVARGAVTVIVALAGLRFGQDSTVDLEIAKRCHRNKAIERGALAVAEEQAFTVVGSVENGRLD